MGVMKSVWRMERVGKVEGSLVEICLQKPGSERIGGGEPIRHQNPLLPVTIWACACRGDQEIGISSSES